MTRRVRVWSLLATGAMALGSLATAGGCSGAPPADAPDALVSSATATPAGVLEGAVGPERVGRYPDEVGVTGCEALGGITHRDWRLRGAWSVEDYTDRSLLLQRSLQPGYPDVDYWLLDLRTGRRYMVYRRPVNASERYVTLAAKLGPRWLAWEEVAPGDDLQFPTGWCLYVARLRSHGGLGRPRLVDSGTTGRRERPHFAFHGHSLCWSVRERRGAGQRHTVWACDLRGADPQPQPVAVTTQAFHTLGISDGHAVVTERVSSRSETLQVKVFDLDSGERLAWIDLANAVPMVQFPAYRHGWLAWSLFRDPEYVASGALYIRDPRGEVRLVNTRAAAHPVLIGGYLFYQSMGRRGTSLPQYGQGAEAVSALHAVDLATMRDAVLASCDYERVGHWVMPVSAPPVERTVVACRQHITSGVFARNRTLIRVFRVE